MLKRVNVWGRLFDLYIDYDLYAGEDILDEQKKRLSMFLSDNTPLKNTEPVIKYCLEHNKDEIGNKIDNIFKYVIPRALFIPRTNSEIVLFCDYKFDIEHGIAVVYKENEIESVISQDELLL